MDNFIETLSEMFYLNQNPIIIADKDGENCIFNKKFEDEYKHVTPTNISSVFTNLKLDTKILEQTCLLVNSDKEVTVNLQFFPASKHWVLEIGRCNCKDWEEFVKFQKTLHIIFLELLTITEENQLYRVLVTRATKLLELDRVGILLYEKDNEMVHGSWGTDSDGTILDQSNFTESLDKASKAQEALALKDYVVYEENVPLSNSGIIIGNGWNATTAFFAGSNPVGWITCDNAVNGLPLPNWKREILGELSRMTGELVFHLRIEKHLQDQIDKKTKELQKAQENLIEMEKLISLGSLVAGVSHEINTPIGVALTVTSHIEDKTTDILDNIKSNSLRKTDLLNYINGNLESSKLAISSLKKAADLIINFKRLAVTKDKDQEILKKINIYQVINSAVESFNIDEEKDDITITNNVDKELVISSSQIALYQIFTNLIRNSLIHGFAQTNHKKIDISLKKTHKYLQITYLDNGVGIPKSLHKKVFDPFFTTNRSGGGVGLGLNIVYNYLLKINGTIKLHNNKPSGINITLKLKID